jgi:uncharacterized phiE125 gp8 family phage protein
MRARVVTAPAAIVSYEEAVARLRLSGSADEKEDVEAMIAAATGNIDGPQGWLGRSIGPQTLEVDFDGFDDLANDLPFGPVIAIDAVSYLDAAGVRHDIAAAGYELLGDRLVPAIGSSWPASTYWATDGRAATRVRYRAGYVVDSAANPLVAAIPAPIKAAVLLMVGDLYANRDTTSGNTAAVAVPMSVTVETLLSPFRKWR